MIYLDKSPEMYCFIGQPVWFRFVTDQQVPVDITILGNDNQVTLSPSPYKKEDKYIIEFDVSDVLRSFFREDYSITNKEEILSTVDNLLFPYTIKIGSEVVFSGLSLKGGVSKYAIKLLHNNLYDIMSYKFLNAFSQFFFTTRTFTRTIYIKHSEISNLLFLHPGSELTFVSGSGEKYIASAFYPRTPSSLNMPLLLQKLNIVDASTKETITVYNQSKEISRLVIHPGVLSENKYKIRFRNSLGVFEYVEITGEAFQKPDFEDENSYQAMNDYQFFEARRTRVLHKDMMEVESGYKTRAEHNFLLDMIKSEEAYFIFPDGVEVLCHISAEPKYQHRIIEPSSISLKIKLIDEEEFVSFDFEIDNNNETKGRIFDSTFNSTFG